MKVLAYLHSRLCLNKVAMCLRVEDDHLDCCGGNALTRDIDRRSFCSGSGRLHFATLSLGAQFSGGKEEWVDGYWIRI